jgi:hypothetical protein
MWKCKACAAKSEQIDSLKNEIGFLRRLVSPPVDNQTIPDSEREVHSVLDAFERPLEIQSYNEGVVSLSEQELAERNAILSGDY